MNVYDCTISSFIQKSFFGNDLIKDSVGKITVVIKKINKKIKINIKVMKRIVHRI